MAAKVIKIFSTFNSKFWSNIGRFSYIAKQKCQAPLINESKTSNNKVSGSKDQFLEYKTEDSHIKQKVDISSSLQNKVAILTTSLYMLN